MAAILSREDELNNKHAFTVYESTQTQESLPLVILISQNIYMSNDTL